MRGRSPLRLSLEPPLLVFENTPAHGIGETAEPDKRQQGQPKRPSLPLAAPRKIPPSRQSIHCFTHTRLEMDKYEDKLLAGKTSSQEFSMKQIGGRQ